MQGKIQYGLLKKDKNMDAVRAELVMRNVEVPPDAGWRVMINLLKEHENKTNDNHQKKYFLPKTNYDKFYWRNE